MLDLRKEFASMIYKNGHWVMLRKALLDQKCSCVDPVTHEKDPDCALCNGSGFKFVDNIVLARKTKLVNSVEMTTDVGLAAIPQWHFYLLYNAKPTHMDWILEIALDPVSSEPITPVKIEKYYDIQDYEVMRGDGGKIIYYDCQVEESTWNVLS